MSAATVVTRERPAARRATTTSRAARPAPHRAPSRPLRQAPPARPRLRIVDADALRRTRRVRIGLWLFAVLGTGSLLAVVAFHVLLAQGQLELDRVEQQIQVEQELYPKKRLEVALASSPEAILPRASALGLVEPEGSATIVEVPGEPAAPVAASSSTSTTAEHEQVKQHLDRAR